jgi:hypothetical protein
VGIWGSAAQLNEDLADPSVDLADKCVNMKIEFIGFGTVSYLLAMSSVKRFPLLVT